MPRILVVDDEPGVQESLRMLLKSEGDVTVAGSVDEALREVALATPDVVLLDLVMPGRSGLDLLEGFAERGVRAPVIVLTATNTVNAAVEAMKRGAADFVTKPFELDALRMKVRDKLEKRELEDEVERLRDEIEERQQLGAMVGRSEAMRDVFRTIERIAKAEATVLVTGESGTGKELVARAIHDLSPRADKPFVAVNCGAIPSELIESELFGHEKGAFTGASERRAGRFEAADGGTLFLDEIGELDQAVQVKLLRALQERTFERVGSSQSITVDVRIVTATNRDLAKRSRTATSARTSTTASPSCRSRSRRSATVARTSGSSRSTSWSGSAPTASSPPQQSAPSKATAGPATSASSRTRSSTPSPWLTARRSTEKTCRRRSATRGRRKPCASSGDKASAVSRRRSRASRPTSCAKPSPPTAGIRPRPPARSGSRAASSS